jgi:hypothetical protein
MTDPDLRVASTAAGTTSAPTARAAAVDVFEAAPFGLVVRTNGSVPAAVRSVGRTGRSWAMRGSVAVRPRSVPPAVVAVAVLGGPARLTEVVIGSGERKGD